MKKMFFGVAILFAVLSQPACGVLIPTCESFLSSICKRLSECSSQDTNTQQEQFSQCMRRIPPETTCRYMTPQQKAEFETVVRNDCHNRVNESTCVGTSFNTGPTCNQIIDNFIRTF